MLRELLELSKSAGGVAEKAVSGTIGNVSNYDCDCAE